MKREVVQNAEDHLNRVVRPVESPVSDVVRALGMCCFGMPEALLRI